MSARVSPQNQGYGVPILTPPNQQNCTNASENSNTDRRPRTTSNTVRVLTRTKIVCSCSRLHLWYPSLKHVEGGEPDLHYNEPTDKTPVLRHDNTNGNFMGPAGPPKDSKEDILSGSGPSPLSPYLANRASVRNLTIPQTPVLDIPPSPLGSPPVEMSKKFQQFLELKNQGVHFNEKLANSSALKNPGLLQKLMNHAGLDEQDQYCTTLSEDVYNPNGFPPWAYKEELAKCQQEVAKKKEEERVKVQRESVDFVSATQSGLSNRGPMPTVNTGAKELRGSDAENFMAGLSRGGTSSPQTDAETARNIYIHRNGGFDQSRSGKNRSPPRRHKRSRSR